MKRNIFFILLILGSNLSASEPKFKGIPFEDKSMEEQDTILANNVAKSVFKYNDYAAPKRLENIAAIILNIAQATKRKHEEQGPYLRSNSDMMAMHKDAFAELDAAILADKAQEEALRTSSFGK